MKKEITPPTFTQIPNTLLDEHMPELSDTAFRIAMIIARQTFGWTLDKATGMRKKDDWIAYSQLETKTGRRRAAISSALRELEEKNLIEIRDGEGNILTNKKERLGKRLFYRLRITCSESEPVKDNQFAFRNSLSEIRFSNTQNKDIQNKNIQNDNTIVLSEKPGFGNSDINDISLYFKEKFKIPKEGCTYKQSRQYWYLLLKESRKGLAGVKWLVDIASKDDFYLHNISSSKDLYYQRVKLIQRMRGGVTSYAKRGIDASNLG